MRNTGSVLAHASLHLQLNQLHNVDDGYLLSPGISGFRFLLKNGCFLKMKMDGLGLISGFAQPLFDVALHLVTSCLLPLPFIAALPFIFALCL